jgi:hypothetical protein
MIYLATTLILLGLLFFVVASLSTEDRKKNRTNPKSKSKQSKNPNYTKKYNFKNRLTIPKEINQKEERIIQERRVFKKGNVPKTSITIPNLEEIPDENLSFFTDKLTPIQVNSIVTPVLNKEFSALLFLDYTGKIALLQKDPDRIQSLLNHFKRIGLVKILKTQNSFLLENRIINQEYKLEDLEKILLFDSAFSLIPKQKIALPTPVLLSNELNQFKSELSLTK